MPQEVSSPHLSAECTVHSAQAAPRVGDMSRVNGGPAPTSPAPCTRCHCKTLSCSWKALTTRTKKFNFLQKFYQLRKIIFPNGRVNVLPLDLIRRLRWLPDEFLPNWDDWRDLGAARPQVSGGLTGHRSLNQPSTHFVLGCHDNSDEKGKCKRKKGTPYAQGEQSKRYWHL